MYDFRFKAEKVEGSLEPFLILLTFCRSQQIAAYGVRNSICDRWDGSHSVSAGRRVARDDVVVPSNTVGSFKHFKFIL
jgi:hypothetical protein